MESSSSGNDTDAKNILVEAIAFGIKNADIGPSYDSDTLSEVYHDTFKNVFAHIQNHEQPESIPHTYVVNENNSDIISDIPNMDPVRDKEEHDYVDDEQQRAFFAFLVKNLKSEKRLKVKQRKSLLSHHGFVYGETQFEEPLKVPLKRRTANLKEHLEQAQLRNYYPKLWKSLPMKYFCYVKQAMLKSERQTVSKIALNKHDQFQSYEKSYEDNIYRISRN
ncbi:hypothetical protein Tco_1438663 [Tanacetum coccineum]